MNKDDNFFYKLKIQIKFKKKNDNMTKMVWEQILDISPFSLKDFNIIDFSLLETNDHINLYHEEKKYNDNKNNYAKEFISENKQSFDDDYLCNRKIKEENKNEIILDYKSITKMDIMNSKYKKYYQELPKFTKNLENINEQDYPYISQDHLNKIWSRFHFRIMTASKIGKAIGFFDSEIVEILGTDIASHEENAFQNVWKELFKPKNSFVSNITYIINKQQYPTNYLELCAEWGKKHELNAIVSIIQYALKINNDLNVKYFETGLHILKKQNINYINTLFKENDIKYDLLPLLGTIPDGFLMWKEQKVLLEIKCPCPFVYPNKKGIVEYREDFYPQTKIKSYHYVQIMLQMLIIGIYKTIFVLWVPSKKIFVAEIDFNKNYTMEILFFLQIIYQWFKKNSMIHFISLKNFLLHHEETYIQHRFQNFLHQTKYLLSQIVFHEENIN